MAKDKKTIVIYSDWIATFEQLTDEEAGKLIKHLLRYVNDQNPTADRMTELLFSHIKQQLKRDLSKWEDIKKQRSEAGKKGMEKRWRNITNDNKTLQNITNDNKPLQSITKITVNDNVNVNVINNKKINTDIWGNEIDEQGKPVKGKSKNFK